MSHQADLFRQLHNGPRLLLLPNAWDSASARIFERAGFPALATTSAGVAFALGYADGQQISRAEMVAASARVARAVKIPVTADVEAGYDDAAETARGLWSAGVVGMNLEDTEGAGIVDIVPRIRAVRAAVPEIVVNARTDIFLNAIGDESTRFDRAVERLNAYRGAGADCLFAPGVTDRATIARLVQAVDGPLNILATAGSPPIAELQAMGVARVTVGSGPMRATLGLLDRIARELRNDGTYRAMLDGALPYAEVNKLLA